MNKLKSILNVALLGGVLVSCSCKESIEGQWYGLKDMSLVTVNFGADNVLSIKSEAFSSLSLSCKYVLNAETDPMEIDLVGASNGMEGAGIIRVNEDKSIEMNCNFGIPGMVARPTEIDPTPKEMTNMYFRLIRDEKKALEPIAFTGKIPAEAQKAFERNKRLGAGINLNAVADGNLHPGYQRDAPLGDDEIRSIGEVGFKSIRFDVSWARHCLKEYPYTIEPEFFDKIDHIVNECLKNDVAVSIDQHYYPLINMEGRCDSTEYAATFVKLDCLWAQIAEHYKDYSSEMLYFDLLNEPNLTLGAEKWNETIASLVKTIRKTNPDRTILVGTPNLGQSWTLGYLKLPEDDWNIIVEFHYYLPHTFTHQGLSYAMVGDYHNVPWMGTDEDKAPIISDLDYCAKWSKEHGRPLNMGEYGAINTADQDSRIRYIGFMREESEKRGFSSHLWGYREPFMIRDEQTGEWIQPILDAMKLK